MNASGMAAAVAARGIGDNAPRPIDLATERVDELIAAADQWRKLKELPNADTAADAVDFARQLFGAYEQADAERASARKPHADAAAAVQATWKPPLEKLAAAREMIGDLLRRWATDHGSVRGKLSGYLYTPHRSWKATAVADIAEACSWAIEHHRADLEAWLIIMASRAARSGQHEIPGFRIEEELS